MKLVMILAGGTGGHVFPALAVANELRDRGMQIVWVGTEKGIESRIVPAAGYDLTTMQVEGLRRKGFLQYLRLPLIVLPAVFQSLRILLHYKPCVLLGMGGFVAGPCAIVGVMLRTPLVIHEQNSIIGLTNRILAPFSKIMFTGFPVQRKRSRTEYCGNPVRKSLLDIVSPAQRFANRSGPKRILVLGGSQGSLSLNSSVPDALELLARNCPIEVWHQTGASGLDIVRSKYSNSGVKANVEAFINEMEKAYAWADLVVCRSGAITLAEVAIVGLGAVLVPYPYAVDDHQTANAQIYVDEGAAFLMPEDELTSQKLADLLQELLGNPKQLLEMALAARRIGKAKASERVADECMKQCGLEPVKSV